MTLPRFMRTRDGLAVEVLAQNETRLEANTNASVVVLVEETNTRKRVGYRRADGTHPLNITQYDLIPYQIDKAAHHLQTVIDPELFKALKTIWGHPPLREWATLGAIHDTDINPVDMAYYLKRLWG